MAIYKVSLQTPSGNYDIECPEEQILLDVAEDEGVDLPYSCRAGTCSSCVGIVTKGSVNQEDQNFLDDDQIDQGYVLTCVARPLSDCTIITHKEDDL